MTNATVQTKRSFQEKVWINVAERNGDDVDFESSFYDVSMNPGDKGFDNQPLSGGGQERDYNAQEPTEFTGTMLIKGVDSEEAKGILSLFQASDNLSNIDGVVSYGNSLQRNDLRVTMLWATDPNVESGTDEVGSDYVALRKIGQNMEVTSAEHDFTDRILTVEVTMQTTAIEADEETNYRADELKEDSDEPLIELPDYDDDWDISEDGITSTA